MTRKSGGALAILLFVALLLTPLSAFAQISLGTASNFGVLGGQEVTNTGPTTVNGSAGVSPGVSFIGFPPGFIVGGTRHVTDAVAAAAQADLITAYDALAVPPCTVDLTGQNLGALPAPLAPGVYCFSSDAFLTGTLRLDFQGNPNSLFIFRIGTALTTAVGSVILPINTGGSVCPPQVYFRVGSSAVLFTNTTFVGNIVALTSITLQTGTSLRGRALARNGTVTLDTNVITACAPALVCPIITVNPATLPNGIVGTPYNQAVTGSGGTAPYTYAVTSGVLPTGLTLDMASGVISGSPTTIGTFNFTITASDFNACPGSRAYTIVIAAAGCPVITLSPNVLPSGAVASPYSTTIAGAGGSAPYTFAVIGGALPPGLTLNPATGAITGHPTVIGLYNFTVRATDSSVVPCSGVRPYSIAIAAALFASGGPTLSWGGMALLVVLLSVAAMFVMSKLSL